MAKEGSTISGFADAFAQAISYALQYGVPLQALVDKFSHVRFEPSGMTRNPEIRFAKSIVDYIFRWLASKFLSPTAQYHAGVNGRELEDANGNGQLTATAPTTPPRAGTPAAQATTSLNEADAPPSTSPSIRSSRATGWFCATGSFGTSSTACTARGDCRDATRRSSGSPSRTPIRSTWTTSAFRRNTRTSVISRGRSSASSPAI